VARHRLPGERELARIAGHSDPNVTLGVYGHLMNAALSEAVARFDRFAGRAVDGR